MENIVKLLLENKIGIFPCDTIWGIIGLADKEPAKKITDLKMRSQSQPFIVLIPNLSALGKLTQNIKPKYQALINKFWPGPLTLIFEKSALVSPKITGNKNTIGIRFPNFEPLNTLLKKLQKPIISTSANISSEKSSFYFTDIPQSILNKVDFIYKNATPPWQRESTIIDCSKDSPTLIRPGALEIDMSSL